MAEKVSTGYTTGVRVRWSGRSRRLWRSVISELQEAEELTKSNSTLTLTMCVNYGGRAELADGVREIARGVAAGRIDPERIDERTISRHMYAPDMPDPDLVVRTSGESRISNYLLWESAYSEFVFTDVLWPDFRTADLRAAILEYQQRERRFGGVEGA